MEFEKIAKAASELTVEQQSEMLFHLMANASAYFKNDLTNERALTSNEAIQLLADSLEKAKE